MRERGSRCDSASGACVTSRFSSIATVAFLASKRLPSAQISSPLYCEPAWRRRLPPARHTLTRQVHRVQFSAIQYPRINESSQGGRRRGVSPLRRTPQTFAVDSDEAIER